MTSSDTLSLLQTFAAPALQREQAFLKALVQTIPDLVWIKDAAGVYLACNPRFEQFVGIVESEIIGKTDFDLVPVEQARSFRNHDQAAMAAGQPTRNEEWLSFADGSHGLFETTKTAMRDSGGQVIGVLGISHDITHRQQTEARLRESEAMLRESQQAARIGSYRFDIVNNRWVSSEVLDQIFGIDAGYERSMEGWQALLHPADREPLMRYLCDEVIGQGQPFDQQYRICRHADGVERWVFGRGEVQTNASGQAQALVGIIQDITERKAAELELQCYRDDLERMIEERTGELVDTQFALDHAGIGIHWADADSGRFVYLNGYAAEMLGYSVEEMMRLSVPELDPNFPPGDFKENTKRLFGDGAAHFESALRTKAGALIPVEIVGYLLPARPGKPGRYITFVTDITQRKLVE